MGGTDVTRGGGEIRDAKLPMPAWVEQVRSHVTVAEGLVQHEHGCKS